MTKTKRSYRTWTALEDKWLAEEYAASTNEELAKALERTPTSIRARAQRIGLSTKDTWLKAEDEILRKLYVNKEYTIHQIARRLGRESRLVYSRAQCLGLRRICTTGNHARRYTEADDEIIREWYPDLKRSVDELAKHLGRKPQSVTYRALHYLGLPSRRDAMRKERRQRHTEFPRKCSTDAGRRPSMPLNAAAFAAAELEHARDVRQRAGMNHLPLEVVASLLRASTESEA